MPSKRPPPLENPPSASDSSSGSSTEEEEEEEEVEDTPEDEPQKQQVVRTPLKFSLKKPSSNSNPTPSSVPKPPSDSSEGEDDSDSADSDSDSDAPAQNHNHAPALDVKPISSKPMLQSDTPDGAASGSVKRRLETEGKESRKDQKKKKVSDLGAEEEESGKKSGEDPKKLFQRLWTDQDEIVILKGMVSFKKKGKDPSTQVAEFFDSIKHLLRPDVNKVQLHGKIRTIRRKYHNALKKVKKPGEDPEFSKPHDAKVYQLSKKVWSEGGSKDDKDDEGETMNVGTEVAKADGEKSKSKRVSEAVSPSPSKPKVTTLPNSSPVVAEKEDLENVSEYKYLNASLLPRGCLMMPIPAPGLEEVFHKKGWNLMGCSNAAGFDKRWKSVMIAETKAYLLRIDLVREQTQAMLDALESSDL